MCITRSGNGDGGGGSGRSCFHTSLKWWRSRGRSSHHSFFSPALIFCLAALLFLGSVAILYAWLTFNPFLRSPYVRTDMSSFGCQEDNEGSWSIGVFYGDSPFSLRPIEDRNLWKNESAAWPVANPVITCASASDAGFASNFVADPFLYVQMSCLLGSLF